MQILLLLLAGMVLLLAVGLLLVSPGSLLHTKYPRWNGNKKVPKNLIDLRRRILRQEETLNRDKDSIQLAVKSRNLALRSLQVLRDIGKGSLGSELIASMDAQILTRLSRDMENLIRELETLRSKNPDIESTDMDELSRVNKNILSLINNLTKQALQASDAEGMLQHLDQEMKASYDTVLRLHEKMVDNFKQKFFSQSR